jgi:two-component system, LytTR family, sensor histidine kinase AlgZ
MTAPTAIRKPSAKHDRAYWLCQMLGWSTYTAGVYAMVSLAGGQKGLKPFLSVSFFSVLGLVETHLLRQRAKQNNWINFPLPKLLLRVIACVLLISLNMVVALVVFDVFVLRVFVYGQMQPIYLLPIFFNISFAISLWCAIYFIVQEFRRRRSAEVRALWAEIAAQQANYRSLKSQLNPHFLFNSLNSVRALIGEDPARAQEMITQLSELLRYTLHAAEMERVTLFEELTAVRDYLAIEKTRFEERLRVRFEIPESALNISVPPMVVQTLVENGIKHGVAQLPAGGELLVHADVAPEELLVTVSNTGALPANGNDAGGTGLQNARQRLALLYGEKASLQLAQQNGCVKATLRIPRDPEVRR